MHYFASVLFYYQMDHKMGDRAVLPPLIDEPAVNYLKEDIAPFCFGRDCDIYCNAIT